jgi:hypothetical protein
LLVYFHQPLVIEHCDLHICGTRTDNQLFIHDARLKN